MIDLDPTLITAHSNKQAVDADGLDDVFVRDWRAGTTTLVSVARTGGPANHHSFAEAISEQGRFIVFSSYATNLVAKDTNDSIDVFVRYRTGR